MEPNAPNTRNIHLSYCLDLLTCLTSPVKCQPFRHPQGHQYATPGRDLLSLDSTCGIKCYLYSYKAQFHVLSLLLMEIPKFH